MCSYMMSILNYFRDVIFLLFPSHPISISNVECVVNHCDPDLLSALFL